MSFSSINRKNPKQARPFPINKPKILITKPKSTNKKIPSVSPSQGVPPPEDLKPLSNNSQSPLSNSLIDEEALDIKKTTEILAREIQNKLSEYKDSNKVHLEKKQKILNEVKVCQNEFQNMRDSVGEVLIEANKTKEELRNIREKIEFETFNDCETSSFNYFKDPVFEQLDSLKNSIEFMNQRLSYTEKELQIKNLENQELKNTLFMLKESILENTALEREEVHSGCQACLIS